MDAFSYYINNELLGAGPLFTSISEGNKRNISLLIATAFAESELNVTSY